MPRLQGIAGHTLSGAVVGAGAGAILAIGEVTLAQGRPIDLATDWDVFLMAIAVEAGLGALLGALLGFLAGVLVPLVARARDRTARSEVDFKRYVQAGGVAVVLGGLAIDQASAGLGSATPLTPVLLLVAGVIGALASYWLVGRLFALSDASGRAIRATATPVVDGRLVRRAAAEQPPWLVSRRAFLTTTFSIGAVAALAIVESRVRSGSGGLPSATNKSLPRVIGASEPNVILITIDTLRADYVGCYGNKEMVTPTIDRLASEGVRFARAVVQQPNTNASHASIFTGLYPKTHGVRLHMQDRLSPRIPTLAHVLHDQGFHTTGLFSWISFEPAFSGLDQGFDEYQGFVTNRPLTLSDPRLEYLAATYRRLVDHLGVLRTSDAALHLRGNVEEELDGRADITTEAALRWLDNRPSGPFFLWLHYFDPHYPYTPPAPFNTMYYPGYQGSIKGGWETIHKMRNGDPFSPEDVHQVRALYSGEISFTDQQLGRFVDSLRSRGLLDSSVVVLSGDHGESLADDGNWLHPANLYFTETRVPLIVRYPPRIAPNQVVEGPVQEIDIMPTILDLLKLPTLESLEGRSLLPLVGAAPTTDQRAAFSALPPDEDDESLIQTNDWAFILNRSQRTRQLFDLQRDPGQGQNITNEQPAVANQLEERLVTWLEV
jgi:arylsulfatase A-like enzyme